MNSGEMALLIAVIVLIFDILWQFAIAGYYAPRKARDLILEDPEFKETREKLKKIDIASIARFQAMLKRLDNFGEFFERVQKKLDGIPTDIKSSISGMIGWETRQINEKVDEIMSGTLEQQYERAFSEGDLKTMEKMQERDMRYQTAYAITSRYMEPEAAEALSGLYATSKPSIRGAISKRVKKWIAGDE